MRKALAVGMLAVVAVMVATDVLAHGRRGRVHVFVGPAWYWGPAWYYPPPAYYYPPPAPPAPPVYVERIDPGESGWWYYCEQSRGYYPYVKECPAGWQRVSPAPAPAAAQ